MPANKKTKPKAASKPAKSSVKKTSSVKKATAKAASAKAAGKSSPAKKAASKKQSAEASDKKTLKVAEKTAAEKKRSALSLAMKEGIEDEETNSEEEEEFDPEAFFAASGGKGLFRAQIMRKDRVDLSISVRFRFLDGPLVFTSELVNLSKGGLCLKTPKNIKPKTVIKVEIPLPHTSELFTVQAEVVWCDALSETKGEEGFFYTGLKFLQMSLAKQTVINNFIQQRRDEIVLAKIGLDKFTDSVPVAGLD